MMGRLSDSSSKSFKKVCSEKSNVSDIERQIEKRTDKRGDAQEHTEEEVSGKGPMVVVDVGG